jgi:hypothetical protein
MRHPLLNALAGGWYGRLTVFAGAKIMLKRRVFLIAGCCCRFVTVQAKSEPVVQTRRRGEQSCVTATMHGSSHSTSGPDASFPRDPFGKKEKRNQTGMSGNRRPRPAAYPVMAARKILPHSAMKRCALPKQAACLGKS